MIRFLDLQKQYLDIKEEIDSSIANVLNSSNYIGGIAVERFEKNFARYIGTKHCVGVGNGTDALEIALWALDLPKGSEVLVPANSFIATSEAVTRNNLKIKFVDCDKYYQMCPKSMEESITPNTSAVIIVHLYGHPAHMTSLLDIAKKHHLKVVEDSAQAHGASYKNQKVGTFGDIATFSFYPGKNLGAYGDGGAILTNDTSLEQRCRQYANHGRSSKYAHEIEGVNSRLDAIQASILDVKLRYLDSWNAKRQEVASKYLSFIQNNAISLPKVDDSVTSVWHLFVIQTTKRDNLQKLLNSHEIQTGIHYPIALPKLKAYEYLKQDCSNFQACKQDSLLLSLPMGEHLLDDEISRVIEVLNSFH